MDRKAFLENLRRTHFAPGDRRQARADADTIASFLKREFGARVIGIGSVFAQDRPFRPTSDIDLAVDGLPAEQFYRASARAADLTRFNLDIIPVDSATPSMLERIREQGVEL